MATLFPDDRSLVDENGNVREHWHHFFKSLVDNQNEDLTETISQQSETITSLQDQLTLLRETIAGSWVIDKWVEIQSTSGTNTLHTMVHNLNSSNIIAVLEESQSVGSKLWEYALDDNTWRYAWSHSVAESLVKARFYRVKKIELEE